MKPESSASQEVASIAQGMPAPVSKPDAAMSRSVPASPAMGGQPDSKTEPAPASKSEAPPAPPHVTAPEAKAQPIPPPKAEPAPIPPQAAAAPPPAPVESKPQPSAPRVAAAPPVAKAPEPRELSCEDRFTLVRQASPMLFHVGKASLENAAIKTLDTLVEAMMACPKARIEIAGHASVEGGEKVNKKLSIKRAKSAEAYLRRAGIAAGRVKTVGYGETKPVAPSTTDENVAKNRRIEIIVR
jgi:outer membrane protein OmpA-like peptidoglycan-associated protein